MEVLLEVANIAAASVLNVLTSFPVFVVTCIGVGAILLLKGCCKMTTGICDCDTTLNGKTVIITGGNSGIGKETARELARRGARIVLACRNASRGSLAVTEIIESTGNNNVVFKQLDLSSFDSVRRFAKGILENEQRLDILINNAGIAAPKERQVTADECELVIQSNHLGHFLLTNLLLDLLKQTAPSRIINVSSTLYSLSPRNWNDIQSVLKYHSLKAYAKSKMANVLFTRELAKKLKGTGVTTNCLHPGLVKTNITRSRVDITEVFKIFTRTRLFLFGKTSAEGAQTTLHLALSKDLENVTGKYFSDCKEHRLCKAALDEESARELWSISEKLVGL